jgi:hypothetical protein
MTMAAMQIAGMKFRAQRSSAERLLCQNRTFLKCCF